MVRGKKMHKVRGKILLFLYLVAVCFTATSCQASEYDWKRLQPESWKLVRMAVDPISSDLILVDIGKNKTLFYNSLVDLEPRDVIPDFDIMHIRGLWLSGDLWVFTGDELMSYGLGLSGEGEWKTQYRLSGPKATLDFYAAPNGDVLFLPFETRTIFICQHAVIEKTILLPEAPDGIVGIAQDHNQAIWALSKIGNLYQYQAGADAWQPAGQVDSGERGTSTAKDLYVDASDNLWAVMEDGVYEFFPATGESVLIQNDIPGNNFEDIFFPDNETTWIVTDAGITAYQDGSARIIGLPWDVEYIWDAAYDPVTGKVFISAVEGVYYRQTK